MTHSPTSVWIVPVSRTHCYIRIGPEQNLATVNFPHDSAEAEVVREALDKHINGAPSAKTGHFSTDKE